jgi:hypothetical protein
MNAVSLLLRAQALGLRLEPRGPDKLAVIPAGKCPSEFADLLRQHKTELLAWLTSLPCPGWGAVPPADLPLNPLPPCLGTANTRRIVDFVVRQIGDEPGPLCEWCLRRETAYWEAYRWSDPMCVYAAARDAACWQLNRNEAAIWELTSAFDEAAPHPAPHANPPDQGAWLPIARQVLAGEFNGADRSTVESLIIGLRWIEHPDAQAAVAQLKRAQF